MMRYAMTGLLFAAAGVAHAQTTVSTYDDLSEGFKGDTFYYNGVTYSDVNSQPGFFPDGNEIIPGDPIFGLGDQVIVENAALLYNDFPDFGSASNGLTFGTSFIPGDNLSIGALSTVTMTLDAEADSASLEMTYYENGPWGGIVYHLDAFSGGSLVASDSFTISDLGGRDNIAFATLSVDGATFDSLELYATFNGQYTGPRGMIDNLTINTVPTPGGLAVLAACGLGCGIRRRRTA